MLTPRPGEPPLTSAEYELLDRYVTVLRLLGRTNPGRAEGTTRQALEAARQLTKEAARLEQALEVMHERGENLIHAKTLARVLRGMEAVRLSERTGPL